MTRTSLKSPSSRLRARMSRMLSFILTALFQRRLQYRPWHSLWRTRVPWYDHTMVRTMVPWYAILLGPWYHMVPCTPCISIAIPTTYTYLVPLVRTYVHVYYVRTFTYTCTHLYVHVYVRTESCDKTLYVRTYVHMYCSSQEVVT